MTTSVRRQWAADEPEPFDPDALPLPARSGASEADLEAEGEPRVVVAVSLVEDHVAEAALLRDPEIVPARVVAPLRLLDVDGVRRRPASMSW
jgi:hypothetical protein